MKVFEIRGDYDRFSGCGVDYDSCKDKWTFTPHSSPMNSASTVPYGNTWWPRPIKKYSKTKKRIGDFVPSIGNNILVMNKFAIDMQEQPQQNNLTCLHQDIGPVKEI